MVEVATKKSYAERYTRPRLRERLKEEIKRSDKGGRPGQWSARKSQQLSREYEKHGGGYKADANREAAASLHEWTEQAWQTTEGSAEAERGGRMHRYLPKEAWERLSPPERRRAERSKQRADRHGEQRASWPPAVRRVMHEMEEERGGAAATKANLYIRAKELGIRGRSKMSKRELAEAVRRAAKRPEAA